jgi:hypothetical protein
MTSQHTPHTTVELAHEFLTAVSSLANQLALEPALVLSLLGLFAKQIIDTDIEAGRPAGEARAARLHQFTHGLNYVPGDEAAADAGGEPGASNDDETRVDRVRELAASLTRMHLEAEAHFGQFGLSWKDIAFAAALSLRSLSALKTGDQAEADAVLRMIIDSAMTQVLIAKRFKNHAEFDAWAEAEAIDPASVVAVEQGAPEARGPLH